MQSLVLHQTAEPPGGPVTLLIQFPSDIFRTKSFASFPRWICFVFVSFHWNVGYSSLTLNYFISVQRTTRYPIYLV